MLKYLLKHQEHTSEWPTELKFVAEVAFQKIIKLSSLGGYLATGSDDGSLCILDTDTWSMVYRYKHHALPIIGINWSENSEIIITVGSDWQVAVWNIAKHQVIYTHDLLFHPEHVSFNPEVWNSFTVTSLKDIFIVSYENSSITMTKFASISDDSGDITSIQYLKNGMISCGTTKGYIYFYESNGNLKKQLKLTDNPILNMSFCYFANIFGVCCGDRNVRVFYLEEFVNDFDKCEVGHSFSNSALRDQWCELTFSRDGDYLYAASKQKTGNICLWHTFAKVEISVISDCSEPLKNLIFDSDRVMLIAIGVKSGKIYVWKTEPLRSWENIMYKFKEINSQERYEAVVSDWDVPDLKGDIKHKEKIDVWTHPTPIDEVMIPYDI